MALAFGELRYSTSRAYDELEDDDTDNSRSIEYNLTVELNDPGEGLAKLSKCDILILSYGTLVTDFCETLLVSKQCIDCGSIKVEEDVPTNIDESSDFRPRKPKPSTLFIMQNSVLVCSVSENVTAVVANRFADKLLSLVAPTCIVMVLSSHHYSQLRGSYTPTDDGNCLVHALHSPSFTYPTAYSQLPQPATLDSVPAAVLTESIVRRKPCVVYPVFTETYSTGDLDLVVDSLIKVFNCDPFKRILPSLDQSKLHQYRAKNPRKEMLDRYM